MNRFSLLLLGLALATSPAFAAAPEPIAFVGGTVHPVSGPAMPGATLLVEGSTILAVGTGITLPAGTQVVDITGKHLYPGFVAAQTDLGMVEIGAVRATDDTREVGDNNAHQRAEVAFNAESVRLLPAARGGVLTAHIVGGGGLFNGTSAAMRVNGWNWRDMTIRAPLGLHLDWPSFAPPPEGTSAEDAAKKRKEQLKVIDDVLANAQAYGQARKAAADKKGPAVDFDPRLEALLPALAGEVPWFLHADSKAQIDSALEWVAEKELQRVVLVAGYDAAAAAERLAKAKIPVILTEIHRIPNRDWEPYDHAFTAAARLHAAGVTFAIAGQSDSSNARNLPFEAATAAAYGLPKDVALAAITLAPAQILGIADRVGSLEAGKEATFFLSTGDPLEIVTKIERVWVAGQELDLTQDHQWKLYQKYANRPKP